MKNLLRLTKINALTIFNFYQVKNSKDQTELKKTLPKFLLIIFAFLYLGFLIYEFAKVTLKGLIALNLTNILIPAFMAITSAYIMFMTIIKVNKTIFDSKDYSILLSMPIKKSVIISSKILLLYITNIIYSLLFLLPAYIAYISVIGGSFIFHLNFWLTYLLVPIVPTIIGCFIGTILTGLSSRFKHKNLLNILFNLIFVCLIMYCSYATENLNSIDMANITNNILTIFNKIYPLTIVYSKALTSFIYLTIFVLISIGSYELYKYFTVLIFDNVNSHLNSITIINKYNSKNNKIHKPLTSLLLKEIKHYFSSSIYVLNTSIGAILLLIATICLLIMGPSKLESIMGMPGLKEQLNSSLPLLIGVFCALSSTTYPSISLEGKNLWISKSLPITTKSIFISKIMLNELIIIPTSILSGLLVAIYFELPFLTCLLTIIVPVLFSLFMGAYGLYLNILSPDFEWTSEVKVIKQSMASFITIFTGLILAIIPLIIKHSMNANLYILLVSVILMILNIVMYYMLFTKGIKKFQTL